MILKSLNKDDIIERSHKISAWDTLRDVPDQWIGYPAGYFKAIIYEEVDLLDVLINTTKESS